MEMNELHASAKEMCELIAKYLIEAKCAPLDLKGMSAENMAKTIFEQCPPNMLGQIVYWYDEAKEYFNHHHTATIVA